MKNIYIVIIALLILPHQVLSATFCVTSAIDLFFALGDADGNNESDHIKIADGNYQINAFNLVYDGINDFDLEISGGWSTLNADPCGQQLLQTPFNTVLDANSGRPLLKLVAGNQSVINISNIQFINGLNLNSNGRAIQFENAEASSITIENCVFSNNISSKGAAIFANAHLFVFKNNLVHANNALSSASIDVSFDSNALGAYFINNTFVSNTTDGNLTTDLGGLAVNVIDNAKVFITNNIFMDNDNHQLRLTGDGYKYQFNNNIVGTQSGVIADESSGNFNTVPLFEIGVLNYAPLSNSPVIDAGLQPPVMPTIPVPFDQKWSIPANDIRGIDRIQGNVVDVGAFEWFVDTPIFVDGFE